MLLENGLVAYHTATMPWREHIVKGIIDAQEDATFDREHFASYGDFSLNFAFVYYVTGADYNKHMDIQQAINPSMLEAFEKQGVDCLFITNFVCEQS